MELKYHKNALRRWFQFSLLEQMANIGSEVGRAAQWEKKDYGKFTNAVERALELFDMTLEDPRWRAQRRLREIGRTRELFCDALTGGKEYGSSLGDLDKYFLPYALAVRKNI